MSHFDSSSMRAAAEILRRRLEPRIQHRRASPIALQITLRHMALATRPERMKRNLTIRRRRQTLAKPSIIRSKERIDTIELAKKSPRPRRLIGKQLANLARIDRMRARNDTPPRHKPRQLKPRHQLNHRPRMPPRYRIKRRHQAHKIAQRSRKNNQHTPNRTSSWCPGRHQNTLSEARDGFHAGEPARFAREAEGPGIFLDASERTPTTESTTIARRPNTGRDMLCGRPAHECSLRG